MPVAGGGFEQCHNAQALVDTATMLVLVRQVTHTANDMQQLAPMLERLATLPEDLPQPQRLMVDADHYSEASVNACEEAGKELSIAIKRNEHHPHWSEPFANPKRLHPLRRPPMSA